MEQVSSHITTAISEYHVGQSSGNPTTNSDAPTSSPAVYYSERIQRMIENRSNFKTEVEFDIENSIVHWSELTNPDSASTGLANHQKRRRWGGLFKIVKMVLAQNINEGSPGLGNRKHFEMLKKDPAWGAFFKDAKVVLGQKINEGAQAEIYDAKVEFEDGDEYGFGSHVVKVMKGDCPLQDFQRQWPVGMLCNASQGRVKGPLMWIKGGTLIDDRFAFVMVRQWGDLRKLVDLKMQLNNNQGPPFEDLKFVKKVMLCIARDMDELHKEYGILHRDLKASNVLLWSLGEELPDNNPHVKAHVVDYECSLGVVGTGFWRAPEILQQLKDGIPSSQIIFTSMSDVYSYGVTCYEIITGCVPFEGHSTRDYDFVLDGNRPELPTWTNLSFDFVIEMIQSCWSHEPLSRPTFSEIVAKFEKMEHSEHINENHMQQEDIFSDFHRNSTAGEDICVRMYFASKNVQRESPLPPWWPAPEQAPYTLPRKTTAQAQGKADALLNDMLERRMNGIDFELHNIIKLRELCRNYGVQVSFETASIRDAFYRTAVQLVHNVCVRRWDEFPIEALGYSRLRGVEMFLLRETVRQFIAHKGACVFPRHKLIEGLDEFFADEGVCKLIESEAVHYFIEEDSVHESNASNHFPDFFSGHGERWSKFSLEVHVREFFASERVLNGFSDERVCKFIEGEAERSFLAGEGVRKFVAGLAGNIGLDAEEAAIMVTASVAARTRAIFVERPWDAILRIANEELKALVQFHENFSPVRNSPEMKMAARGLLCLPVEHRRYLLAIYIWVGGENTEWLAKEVLSLS